MVSISMGEFMENAIVAVVDARPEGYWQFAEAAENGGLYCRYATTAREAMRLAEQAEPVLWLINLNLPDLDGRELCRMLRARHPEAPQFLVADEYERQAEIAVLAAGRHFVCKPVPTGVLETCPAVSGMRDGAQSQRSESPPVASRS